MDNVCEKQASQKDVLSLALVGDAVFSLYVRDRLIRAHDYKSGYLSRLCVKYVNASAQCKMLYALEGQLSVQEESVVRRARNANSYSKAKNASIDEYKKATALEALLGYLHICGQAARLEQVQEICFDAIK